MQDLTVKQLVQLLKLIKENPEHMKAVIENLPDNQQKQLRDAYKEIVRLRLIK